jgi:lipopolysaccharide transport system ATP-binding protein
MMSDTIIQVENLSKKYTIGHQKERYVTLRDAIANGVKSLGNAFRYPRTQVPNPEYEDFWALKDVSFEVKQGDRIGIIGRNGAGKSTLLKILSRITEPTQGRISIKGRVASLLEVGTGFHPELTGRENIYLNGAILGMDRTEIKKKFDEMVAFAEVERFLDTPVKRYSSGMYVRLAFAVAAHLEPEILVVDEVLAVGDAQFQKKCLDKMEDAGKEGKTVIFVSHNMAAIQTLCTQAIHLCDGQVVGIGSLEVEIENYLNAYRNQTGTNKSNLLHLSQNLILQKLEISPNPVVSGSPLQLLMEFWSNHTTTIDELVILIYSSLGVRVAILDLKKTNKKYRITDAFTYQICVNVDSFYLVEGDYRIGIYLRTDAIHKDFLDLTNITVISKVTLGDAVPYAKSYRGIVEFTFDISCNEDINPKSVVSL